MFFISIAGTRRVIAALVSMALIMGAADDLSGESIGSIEVLRGEVDLNDGELHIAAGELRALFEREVLVTGPNTRLLVHLKDGSRLAVPGNTQLAVLEMIESNQGPSLWTILLNRGTLRWQASASPQNFACHILTELGSLGYHGDWLECSLGAKQLLKCRAAKGSRGIWIDDQSGVIDFSLGAWIMEKGQSPRQVPDGGGSFLEKQESWPVHTEGAREFFWRDYRGFQEHLKNLRQEVRDQINQILLGEQNDEPV